MLVLAESALHFLLDILQIRFIEKLKRSSNEFSCMSLIVPAVAVLLLCGIYFTLN